MAQQLSELPPLALIAFGVTVAIIFVVRYAGISAGANSSTQKSSTTAEVAAVIVDPTALNNATAAVKELAAELKADREQKDDHVHMLCRRLETLAGEMEGLTRSIGSLVLEMARKR